MASRTDADASTSSGTVARVTMLLRVLAEIEHDASLSEIAQRMQLPASTTHRLLSLLQDQGFVARGQANRTYRPGLEFLRVGGLVASRAELPVVAQGYMQAVVDACDETCMLSVHVPHSRTSMIVRAIYGSHPLRYEATLYQPSSLVWGATGQGILAFLPPQAIEEVIAQQEPSPADGKPLRPAQVRRALAEVRERGYAHTRGQKIPGAVGLSVPVFDAQGVVAALCITLPDSRFRPAMEARLAKVLKGQAQRLSAVLGWRGATA